MFNLCAGFEHLMMSSDVLQGGKTHISMQTSRQTQTNMLVL